MAVDVFPAELDVEYLGSPASHRAGWWKLKSDFSYRASDLSITVPAGFCTDFASIPQVVWDILPPTGNYAEAAVIHDFLYYQQGYLPPLKLSRAKCDGVLLAAMLALGVGRVTRSIIYTAVRIGGWTAWRSRRPPADPPAAAP